MSDPTGADLVAGAQKEWVRAPLSRFLTPKVEAVNVDPDQIYPTVGVLNRGRGLLYRDPVAGTSTAYKKLNRIGPGVLIYSRLKAFEGAITVTPNDLPESFASQEFPTFAFASDADPDFFRILTTTQNMWDALQGVSKGMGGRRERVKPIDFLNILIDIPPMPVQERIVEVIRAVDEQITALDGEANALEGVYRAAMSQLWRTAQGDEAESRSFGEVMHLDVVRTPMEAGTIYRLAGVLNAGKGLVDKGEIDGAGTEYTAMNVLRENQVVMRKLTAWEGPITVVPSEFDGFVASNEFPTFTLAGDVDPGWMKHVCRTPRLWAEMQSRVVGTVQRRKRLNPDQLLAVALPVPPRPEQEKVAEALDAIEGQIAVIRTEATSLRQARDALLSGLLDGTIEIESAELKV